MEVFQLILVGFMGVLISALTHAVAEAITKNKWVRRIVPVVTFAVLVLLYLKYVY